MDTPCIIICTILAIANRSHDALMSAILDGDDNAAAYDKVSSFNDGGQRSKESAANNERSTALCKVEMQTPYMPTRQIHEFAAMGWRAM